MASLFECVQVDFGPLLVRGVAFNGVDDDHCVQVVQHSRPSQGGPVATGVLFAVPLVVLGLAEKNGRPWKKDTGLMEFLRLL
jgi:hypothetical protein